MKKLIILLIGLFVPIINVSALNQDVVIGDFKFFWSNDIDLSEKTINIETDETYHPNDRKWVGLPSIAKTHEGRLWVAFMTGGFLEPDYLNYNVLYYSDDFGETWSENFLIIESTNEKRAVYDPRMFMDNDGIFWLYLNYGGTKGIIIENPDCFEPEKNLKFSKTVYVLTTYPMAHRPTLLSNQWDNIWIAPVESSIHLQTQKVFSSSKKVIWEELSTITTSSPGIKRFNESQIVELSDGKLMMISRLDGGSGIERSYSLDGGKNWTPPQTDLGAPYLGPGSKMHIQRLKSGALLLLNHASTTAREKLFVYLSYDDGLTWPYSLPLDEREINGGYWGVSYPEAAMQQGENGDIYIIWDQRTPLVEINFSRLTEDDIKAGKICNHSIGFKSIIRNSNYYDIIKVEELYPQELTVIEKTNKSDIIAQLPTSFTISDSINGTYQIEGSWVSNNYNANITGRYTFIFKETTHQDPYRLDSHGLLKVVVNVIHESKKINSTLVISITIIPLVISIGWFIFKKCKNKKEDLIK